MEVRYVGERSGARDREVLATLTKADELVVIGGVKDGYVNVQSANASGWVKVVLVDKR